ncbi:unnamed protein product [Arabidopsis thaliana]|uniref:(thale cress) hypothetical protein n=1 Tax=Arabidopsis thaliana TaxID=3702 RepID=A0A7G2DV55_ARATH|nr:unnamed protein product [Arabidopsis thaliana]
MSSVAFLDLRPPPAPPPESSSPPTPPEPPDPPDPQICLSFNVSLAQSPLTTSVPLLLAKSLNSFRVLLLDESLFTNWFGEMFLHNSGLTQSISMGLDILVSTFLLSSSTLIALLRSLTKCEDITCFTDAAWNASSSSCGMGWIFKTQHQRVIHQGSSSRLHTLSALAAEALVIKSVLTAALRMEFNSPPSQFARTLKSSYLCSIQRPQRMSLRGYFMILPVCVFHSYLLNSALFHV